MDFIFKPALARAEETWKLEGTRLIGPEVSVELSEVTVCNFNYTPIKRGMTSAELKLTANGAPVTLECMAKVGTDHRDTFLRLSIEVFRVLGLQKPELPVTSTGTDTLAWGFTGIGVIAGLWGIYFAVANADSFALGVGAVMVLMGGFFVWVGSPWNANKPKSLTEATEWLERLRALPA